MKLARRQFFRQMATGIATSAALPVLGKSAWSGNWRSMQAGTAGSQIHLDANENPYGPSAAALDAMRGDAGVANRYPKHEYGDLVNAIATGHSVKPEQVTLGCGSSENLRMAANAFLGPGKTLLLASPTFDMIARQARNLGAEVVYVPLTAGTYAHDLDAMLAHTTNTTGLVYICNPNNPTGTLTPRADLEAFIRKLPPSYYVLMDEAYHHFVAGAPTYTSFLDKPVDDERVIVARTFSKIYGLAGMRVGYAVASPATTRRLVGQSMQFSMSVLAARAALAAVNDPNAVPFCATRNAGDRQEFYKQAKTRGLTLIESYANFLMIQTGRPIEDVLDHFRKNNVFIGRPFPPMTQFARVSFGTPPEMVEFWRVWDAMPKA